MIKRPLPIIGCAYLLSLAVVFCFNLSFDCAILVGAIACAGVCAVCLIKRFSLNVLRVVLLSVLAFAAGLMIASYKTVEVPRQVSAVYGQKARITAVMLDKKSQRGSKYDYEIITTAVALFNEQTKQYTSSGVPQQIKMRLTVTAPLDAVYYDSLTTDVNITPPTPLISDSPYVVRRADGIYAFAYSYGDIDYQSPANYPLMAVLRTWRDKVNSAIVHAVDGEAGRVAAAMLTGQRGIISSKVQADFRDAGLSHMLAVSGMHTAILAQFLLILLGLFGVPKKASAVVCMVAVLFFAAFTGFTPSVVRAGVMACTLFTAQLFNRKNDVKNSIAFAALLLCGANPAVLLDAGFLLSFAATLSILLLAPAMDAAVKRFMPWLWKHLKWAVQAVTISLSATLFTYPISAVMFGRVSIIGPVTNVLVTPLAPLQMVASLFTGIFGAIASEGFLAQAAGMVTKVTTLMIMRVATAFAAVDYAATSVNILLAFVLAAACIGLAALIRAVKRRFKNALALAAAASVLLAAGIACGMVQAGQNRVYVAIPNSALSETAILYNSSAAAVLAGADTKKSATGAGYYVGSIGMGEVQTLTVPYLNDASWMTAKDILSRFDVGRTILARNSIRFEELTSGSAAYSELSFNQMNTVPLFDGYIAQVVCQQKGSAVYITTNGVPILFLYGKADASRLPQSFRRVEVCVLSGYLPEGFHSISARYYIANDACIEKNKEQFRGKSLFRAAESKRLVFSCALNKTLRLEEGTVDLYG